MLNKETKLAALAVTAVCCTALASCTSESDILHIIPPHKEADGQSVAAPTFTTQTTEITTAMTTETTETTVTTAVTTRPPDIYRGSIFDCSRNLLTFSEVNDDGSEMRHFTDEYRIPTGNIISSYSGGIDTVFEETLRIRNSSPVNGRNDIGQSVMLTIDGDVQADIYNYMQEQKMVGSVVVMRTDGSLMAEVSCPSYDPMKYDVNMVYRDELEPGTLGNKAFQNAPPGSCFKIMSEVISDMNGINCLYDEGTWEIDGAEIVNWDHETGFYPVEERTLLSAFVNSSNIFFAKSFDIIGEEAAEYCLDSVFHFLSPIYCDFGPIENMFVINNPDDLRRSAFGQANVRTCPIYLAALGREAVFGEMVKPFVVQSVVDTNNPRKTVFPGSAPYETLAEIPWEYRQNLLDGMAGVAANLGVWCPDGYNFYAKTGTAETGAEDILYITGILQNYTENCGDGNVWTDYSNYCGSYIIVMQLQNPSEFKFDFASESGALYQGIVNIVTG